MCSLPVFRIAFGWLYATPGAYMLWWSFIPVLIGLPVPCWKAPSPDLGNIVRVEGSRFSSMITLHMVWSMWPSQRWICLSPALLSRPWTITECPPNIAVAWRPLQMTRCWAKRKILIIREDELPAGPIFMILLQLSLALLCFPLMKGFLLVLEDLSYAPRNLFQIVLTVHMICHHFNWWLNVILPLLSDIWTFWQPSRSVESHFHALLVCSFVVADVCCLTLFLWNVV